MIRSRFFKSVGVGNLLVAASLFLAGTARAQWVTESYPLLPGWNGIWLPHDCAHVPIDELLAGAPDIGEVWLWNPVSGSGQFAESPPLPLSPDVAWQVWRRGDPAQSTLDRLIGGAGYLVNVTGSGFTLALTGRPIPPRYALSGSGQNLVGFPMQTPDSSTQRNMEKFFSYDAVLKTAPPVFAYRGGPLKDTNPQQNPFRITTPRTTPLSRGKAYWVNLSEHTGYYGPVGVTVLGSQLNFGDTLSFVTVRLRNTIELAQNRSVTATIAPALSADPPAGQEPKAGSVPLLVRGPRDADTLDFTYTPLGAGVSRTLAPGEQTEITLAVDRVAMGGSPGEVYESLLQITDSLNLTRIHLGVRAEVPSLTGVWIGSAVVSAVDQIVGQTPTEGDAAAPSQFPIRLILHRSDAGEVRVLQRIYLGAAGDTLLASSEEEGITAEATGKISRFSSASFPPGDPWTATGDIGTAGEVSFSVALGYTASTNPFLHNYHPDHDNLDARFEKTLPEGVESPDVLRAIRLTFQPSLPGLTDNGFGTTTLGGDYEETITGLRSQAVRVSGSFVLRRVAPAPVLLTP